MAWKLNFILAVIIVEIEKKVQWDIGTIGQILIEELFMEGLLLITRICKNMKISLLPIYEKGEFRKRASIENVNAELNNSRPVE